jgi:hypothetical protein
VERGADLVVIQEAYRSKEEEYQIIHLAVRLIRANRVMTGVRVDTIVTVDELGDLRSQGDIQAFDINNK